VLAAIYNGVRIHLTFPPQFPAVIYQKKLTYLIHCLFWYRYVWQDVRSDTCEGCSTELSRDLCVAIARVTQQWQNTMPRFPAPWSSRSVTELLFAYDRSVPRTSGLFFQRSSWPFGNQIEGSKRLRLARRFTLVHMRERSGREREIDKGSLLWFFISIRKTAGKNRPIHFRRKYERWKLSFLEKTFNRFRNNMLVRNLLLIKFCRRWLES